MERTYQNSRSAGRNGGRRRPSARADARNRGNRERTSNANVTDAVRGCSPSPGQILQLPDDIFYIILKFLDPVSLCRLAQVCQRFNYLVAEDTVWQAWEKERTVLRSKTLRCPFGAKERYRLALNWEAGKRREEFLRKMKYLMLPWLQRVDNTLWMSRHQKIVKLDIQANGTVRDAPFRLQGATTKNDVTRFVVKNGLIVSGHRGGILSAWEASSGVQLLHLCPHTSDTQCVDILDDVIVSGSKDRTVKVLSMYPGKLEGSVKQSFNIYDRVWSLSAAEGTSTVAVGTACYNNTAIVVLDLNRGEVMCNLGDDHKRGSGVLDVVFESPQTLLTCGHDTYLRVWDLRTHTCVQMWEDPYDSVQYCIQTDGQNTILTGTARHGVVRLWDKRHKEHVAAYYSGDAYSPVYSLAATSQHLHVGLDSGLYFADFSIR